MVQVIVAVEEVTSATEILEIAGATGSAADVEKEIEKGNIKVVTLGRKSFADGLMQDFRIDLGEAESIALSIERNVLFLGIDDKEAIKVCRVYGVPFLTALAFVVKLAKEKQIQKEEAALALNKLQQICLFSDEVMKEALKEGGLNGRSD